MGACRSTSKTGHSDEDGKAGGYASGLVHIQLPVTTAAMIGTIDQGQGAKTSASAMLTAKATLAAIFALRVIAPRVRQATIWRPNTGCSSSHASSRGDERAKQKAARITKGTVGSNGNTAPIAPSARDSQPQTK